MRRRAWTVTIVLLVASAAEARGSKHMDDLRSVLLRQVPEILTTYDARTGRFGTGIWLCTDQNVMYPLAVAYSLNAPDNKYHRDSRLLEIIMKAGDALIDEADADGKWEFRKKDGSTWGKISMPWTYSRWIRTFEIIRRDMPPDRRRRWADALTLGYGVIAREQLHRVQNIPAHHAMGLYAAGKVLNRPEWCRQAAEFLIRVADAQAEGGYWSEHAGPVVLYNAVYVEVLGLYYAMSRDDRVMPALEKAARFHRHFTYPNGHAVETIDERNPYHKEVGTGNIGFAFTEDGRAYLATQWKHYGIDKLPADSIAPFLHYGGIDLPEDRPQTLLPLFVLTERGADRAAVVRRGPWFVCLSAYTAPLSSERWIQDRQNFVSIYHDKLGLIAGGGNTKLQPAWSSFTVGDMGLLRHKEGDENPSFTPAGPLLHVPSAARLLRSPDVGLDLTYGSDTCRIRVRPIDDRRLEYAIEAKPQSDKPVVAHLALLPRLGRPLETGGGYTNTLGDAVVDLSPEQVGGRITHGGYRVQVPATASLHWPALPHNPYRKDGRAEPAEGRIEIRVPFDGQHTAYVLVFEVLMSD